MKEECTQQTIFGTCREPIKTDKFEKTKKKIDKFKKFRYDNTQMDYCNKKYLKKKLQEEFITHMERGIYELKYAYKIIKQMYDTTEFFEERSTIEFDKKGEWQYFKKMISWFVKKLNDCYKIRNEMR